MTRYITRRSRAKHWGEIIGLFVLPVLLCAYGVIPASWRFLALAAVTMIIVGIVIKERWTLVDLGIRADNLRVAFLPYTLFTVGGVVLITGLARAFGQQPLDRWWTQMHFLFAFIPLSIAQEFVFRGFLMRRLRSMFQTPSVVVGVNALLFAFLHIIYPGQEILFPLAFTGGLGFALVYYLFPNLILASFAHMTLNFFATLYSFFVFPST